MPRSSGFLLLTLALPVMLLGQETPSSMRQNVTRSLVFVDRDQVPLSPLVAAPSQWGHLAVLSPSERATTDLMIDIAPEAAPEAKEAARKVMETWKAGAYDEAIDLYATVSTMSDMQNASTILRYHSSAPASLEKLTAASLQIGTTDSILSVDMVCDKSNRHMFAVIDYDGSSRGFELYRSADAGRTWSRELTVGMSNLLLDAKLTFVDSLLHIFYRSTNGTALRWMRCDTAGNPVKFPGGSNTLTLHSGTPVVNEVVAFSNHLYNDNRIYYATLLANHTAHLYFAPSDSTSFTEHSYTSGVLRGLSFVWAAATKPNYVASYIDTAFQIQIDSIYSPTAKWTHKVTAPNGGTATSLSYHQDTLLCAYEIDNWCEYQISYNGGRTWLYGDVDTGTTVRREYPVVSLEKGQGMAIIYRYYTLTRQARAVTRPYKNPGPGNGWSSPVSFASEEPAPYPAAIAALGDGRWGIVYIAYGGPLAAYFTTITGPLTGVETPKEMKPSSFALDQNYPNPFNPKTGIRFEVPGVSDVNLTVYDILGREVAVLVNEKKVAGRYEVTFDGSNLASGAYFYRLQAGGFVQTRKLLLVR